MEIKKFDADFELINNLFGFEPLDCARRPNGDLVYLNPAGQKFVLSPAEIDILSQKRKIKKEKSVQEEKRSHHKKSEPVDPYKAEMDYLGGEGDPKELTEEQAPYVAEPTPEEKALGELGQIEADDL